MNTNLAHKIVYARAGGHEEEARQLEKEYRDWLIEDARQNTEFEKITLEIEKGYLKVVALCILPLIAVLSWKLYEILFI